MYINKIKAVLSDPSRFFANLKEKSVQDALLYYIILSAFSFVMGYIMYLLFGDLVTKYLFSMLNLENNMPQLSAMKMFGQFVLGYILGIVFSFILAGILFVWILIFGGNKGYNKSYQLYVYSQTPSFLFNWIPFIGIIASIYSFVLLVVGTKKIYNFSTAKALLIYLIPLAILFILAIAFMGLAFLAILKSGASLA